MKHIYYYAVLSFIFKNGHGKVIFGDSGKNSYYFGVEVTSYLLGRSLKELLIILFWVLVVRVESYMGFPGGSVVKNSPANAGDMGSVPGLGRSGEGTGKPPQYSRLGYPMEKRRLECYSLWYHRIVRHDLSTKQQPPNKMNPAIPVSVIFPEDFRILISGTIKPF